MIVKSIFKLTKKRSRSHPDKLTPDEIYHKLSKGHPAKEARDYLKKVNDKREYYAKVLNTGSM